MGTVLIIIYLFLLILSLSIPNARNSKYVFKQIQWSLYFILVCIVTFRSPEMHDYVNYVDAFNDQGEGRMEPAFVLIRSITKLISSNYLVFFFIMGSISVYFNLYAIKTMANYPILSTLFYLSNMFILHDMIQIRCALAAGLFLLAIPSLVKRDLKKYLLIISLCVCCHYSSIVLYPLYLLSPKTLNRVYYLGLIIFVYILYFVGISCGKLVELIPFAFVQNLWKIYTLSMIDGVGVEINVFNSFQLIRCFVCILLVIYSKQIAPNNQLFIIWIKVYVISVACFVLFSDIPVISFRISELLQAVEFLLYPMLMYLPLRHCRFLKKSITLIISCMIFFLVSFYGSLLK